MAFFDHLPPFVDSFYHIQVDIFDYLPTSPCKRSLGTTPKCTYLRYWVLILFWHRSIKWEKGSKDMSKPSIGVCYRVVPHLQIIKKKYIRISLILNHLRSRSIKKYIFLQTEIIESKVLFIFSGGRYFGTIFFDNILWCYVLMIQINHLRSLETCQRSWFTQILTPSTRKFKMKNLKIDFGP